LFGLISLYYQLIKSRWVRPTRKHQTNVSDQRDEDLENGNILNVHSKSRVGSGTCENGQNCVVVIENP
jgi:hypothetical protein